MTVKFSPRGSGANQLAVSLAADFTSNEWEIPYKAIVGLEMTWSGADAFNATVILEQSMVANPTTDSDWDEVLGSGFCIEAESGTQTWEHQAFTGRWLRFNYQANNVSSGTADLHIFTKRDT